ncbi:DUF3299 domain-containing protein [Vibrio sp. FNV 38]|nr:DUF3299 domain-containing protein [Vibrio sp. FNV 38]
MSSANAFANNEQMITWTDLVPPPSETITLPPLNQYQVSLMYDIVAYQNAAQRRDMSEIETNKYNQNKTDFSETGANLEALLRLRERAVTVERERYSRLDDNMTFDEVTIGGFMVPLEMEGITTKQFLLVPTAGACVHTPPPPISQIIVVDIEQGYDLVDLYQPIAVTGDISTAKQQLNVDYIDGNGDIEAGYVMTASNVRLY